MTQKFIRILREKFTEALQEKTGWGRNDVLALFERCMTDAAAECIADEVMPT